MCTLGCLSNLSCASSVLCGREFNSGEMTRSLACWRKPTNQKINERLLAPETSPVDPWPRGNRGKWWLVPPHNSDIRDSHEYILHQVSGVLHGKVAGGWWKKLGWQKLLALSHMIPLTSHIFKNNLCTLRCRSNLSCVTANFIHPWLKRGALSSIMRVVE